MKASGTAPLNQIREARISLLIRLLRKNHFRLLATLVASRKANRSWFQSVWQDLLWCTCFSPKLSSMQGASLSEWCNFLVQPAALRVIRHACRSPEVQNCAAWSFNSVLPDAAPAPGNFPCNFCLKSFSSWRALQVHRSQLHGFRMPSRCRVDGTHCPVCLKHFGARSRVLRHLAERRSWCRPIVEKVYSPLEPAYVDELDALDAVDLRAGRKQGLRSGTFSGRAMQLPGPLIRHLFDVEMMTSLGLVPAARGSS